MKKIYEDINRILSEKKFTSSSRSQPISDVKFKEVRDFVPDLKTPINRRGGPPDGLPKRLAGSFGRGVNALALADLLSTHGELNTGEDDELKKIRASDPKYQEAERQLNKPRPVNFRDDKGIQYDTQGNPFRDPNKEAMATHSAITKKDVVPQASSISTTRRATSKRVASDNTASSNQTTANTYWTNPNQPAKSEPAKPEPAKPEPAKPEAAKPEAAKPEAAKPAWTEPAYPEPKSNSVKPEPPKAEPKADVSSVAKEYIKANASSKPEHTSTEEKPEEKSKRVKIIKSTTSESSVLGRIRNALSEKHQVDEVVGVGTKAIKYGPSAIRFGYKFFRDVFKDNKSEVTVTKPPPAPKPESKPQPQLPPPASAAKVERQVSTSKDVVKTEPKQPSVNVSKDAKTERQVNVSKEVRSDKSEKGRRIGQKNATQDVVVRQAEPVKSDNVPAVRTDNKPVVKTDNVPAVRTQTGTAVVTTTTTKNQVETKPENQSKLKRVGPPPPPPPVDQKTDEPEPPKKNTFKHGPEPLIFKNEPPREEPKPQPNNVVPPEPPAPPSPPPPPPPKKGPSLVDPIPQTNVVVPPTPTPRKTTPDCPTGECDPNLDVKAMYNKLASATSKSYKESKPKFSMEDTQMNINKKFNVSDNLYQSVMEVMTKSKKPGSVPGNQAERDLAAKHGDPDRITHGDILVARGVVKSNKPPVKSVKEDWVDSKGKFHKEAPPPGQVPSPDEGYRPPKKKTQPGSTTKAVDDMEEEINISKTVGKVVGSVEKGVSNMAKDFEAGREEAKKEKRLPVAMVNSPVAKASAMLSAKDATGDTASTSSRPYLRTTPVSTSSSESDTPTDILHVKSLNKGEDDELAKRRAADPKYQSLARSTQKESRDTPGNGYEHQCAIHVKSESFGEGRTITTQHADPDAHGNIAWYDVMFEHGIEKYVPTDELEVLVSEMHMHSKRKKKGM